MLLRIKENIMYRLLQTKEYDKFRYKEGGLII